MWVDGWVVWVDLVKMGWAGGVVGMGWLVGWLVVLFGWLFGRLAGRLVGWLACLVWCGLVWLDWLLGRLVQNK